MKNESTSNKIVLDTKPLIKLFAKESGWAAVQKILQYVEAGKIEASLSVVTLTEIYYKYLHERRLDLAKARIAELKYAVYVKKLVINEETAIKAGEFKGKYNIPVADAFIAAGAFFENAMVLTDDEAFVKIAEIKTATEKEFLSRFEQ